MLASTIQFSNNNPAPTPTHTRASMNNQAQETNNVASCPNSVPTPHHKPPTTTLPTTKAYYAAINNPQ